MPRLLVVDDDPAIRLFIRRTLESRGFEVREAGDGSQVLRIFREDPPDILLCDVYMPNVNGIEVLRQLTSEFIGVKVIAMSGAPGGLDLLPVARQLGAWDVLYKPFDQADLITAIERVLRSD